MNFFYLLEQERKRLGLSQADAGHICGVSREMWGKYERDQAVPGADVLEAFAAAGADVNYILSGRPTEGLAQPQPIQASENVRPYGLSADETTLLEGYRRAPAEVRAALLVLIGCAGAPAAPRKTIPRPARIVERVSDLPTQKFAPPRKRKSETK